MAVRIERVSTGVEGLDELIEGGLPRSSMTLISGSPGTGKTTLALQFLYDGATKYKESGLYVTMSEPAKNLRVEAKRLGMNFDQLEKEGKMVFMEHHMRDRGFLQKINEAVAKTGAKRLVIDSLASLTSFTPLMEPVKEGHERVMDLMGKDVLVMPAVIGENMVRTFIQRLIVDLRVLNCTTMLITEQAEDDKWLSRDTVSEFMCDGVIVMRALTMTGESGRSLTVRKMRMTKHTLDVHELLITKDGLKVLPAERGVKI